MQTNDHPVFLIQRISAFDTGSVRYREKLPVKTIIGACVGGGLFLIILLCVSVVVLYKRKTSNRNHQQQALQGQPQPKQETTTHKNAKNVNVTEQGYINDHMAPNHGTPFNPLADNGEYLNTAPVRGIPMSQMSDAGDYENLHMAPKERNVMTA